MTEGNAPSLPGQLDDPFFQLMLAPWKLAEAMHDCNVELCHGLARHIFRPAFPPHPHEAHYQLEIPDPIAMKDEQDLFA